MIDIHAHILPNLDDGSESLEESLEMAELAVESGVEIMAATPHSNQMGRFENFQSVQLEQSFEQLREALKREKIQLQILEGMEIWASDDIAQKIKNKQLGGINRTAYYLVEFPFDADPWWIRECLEEIFETGNIPLIAHPERYFCVQDYPELVYEWVQNGCVTQMNKGSILGRFGRSVMKTTHILLKNDLISCMASDAHRSYVRTPYMREAKEELIRLGGYEFAWYLTEKNPERIIRNQQISLHGRRPEKRRKYLLPVYR